MLRLEDDLTREIDELGSNEIVVGRKLRRSHVFQSKLDEIKKIYLQYPKMMNRNFFLLCLQYVKLSCYVLLYGVMCSVERKS